MPIQVVAQALRVCEQFAHIIRPNPPEAIPSNLTPVVSPLFDAVNKRLSAQDQDQEVKECAILCMARIVANLGDVLSKQVWGAMGWLCTAVLNQLVASAAYDI